MSEGPLPARGGAGSVELRERGLGWPHLLSPSSRPRAESRPRVVRTAGSALKLQISPLPSA